MTSFEAPVFGKRYTVEEYLKLEKLSETKHEFQHGKLLPLPGESKNANRIAGKCEFLLRLQLQKKGLRFFRSSVMMVVEDNEIYRYPEFIIAPASDGSDPHLVRQPLLLEVTSEESDHRDRATKLGDYLGMPTLQCYQYEHSVEAYLRDEKGWRFFSCKNPEDEIDFPFLGAKPLLSDIYEKVVFEE